MTGEAPRQAMVAGAAAAAVPAVVLDPTAVMVVQLAGDEPVEWEVVEVDAAAVPGAQGPRCLLFSRPDCIRRVWDYPVNWRTLDAAGAPGGAP